MIRVFFGSPGVGKSTLCCKMAKKALQRRGLRRQKDPLYENAYINFTNTVPGVRTCNFDKVGEWTFPEYSYIALDEAGIEFNSRKTKTLPQYTIAWFKLHRHYRCDVDVFSQSWDDMDITIRRLATQLWYMYRIGPFTLCRKVYKTCMIDKNTHQIVDGYRMPSMLWLLLWPLQLGYPFEKKFTLTFRPYYYKYFDSYERMELPVKDFPANAAAPEVDRVSLIGKIRNRFRK